MDTLMARQTCRHPEAPASAPPTRCLSISIATCAVVIPQADRAQIRQLGECFHEHVPCLSRVNEYIAGDDVGLVIYSDWRAHVNTLMVWIWKGVHVDDHLPQLFRQGGMVGDIHKDL